MSYASNFPDESDEQPVITHGASRAIRPDALGMWALLLVLAIAIVGVFLVIERHWRRGSFLIGGACLLGAFLRAVLPRKLAGLLVVRTKLFDVLTLAISGVTVMVLALAVPGIYVP